MPQRRWKDLSELGTSKTVSLAAGQAAREEPPPEEVVVSAAVDAVEDGESELGFDCVVVGMFEEDSSVALRQ